LGLVVPEVDDERAHSLAAEIGHDLAEDPAVRTGVSTSYLVVAVVNCGRCGRDRLFSTLVREL